MFIGGNWKLHLDTQSATQLTQEIVAGLSDKQAAEIVLFPTFVHLPVVRDALCNSDVKLGAQNQSEHEQGAYTGEVSAWMLKDVGCQYVLLGHSERRHVYHETDAMIAKKLTRAFEAGLKPVLCVGETLDERDDDRASEVVLQQLNAAFADCDVAQIQTTVIAYEPVWAIGTGRVATPDQAQTMHAIIRGFLHDRVGDKARDVQIIYGGSVKPDNAKDIFSKPDVDGGLIGGASLVAEDFLAICSAF